MADFEVVEISTDLLIVGGGMAACGAAVEAKYWAGDDIKVLLVDKAAMERSGAVAQGLSAINTYIGMSGRAAPEVGGTTGQHTPEEFVRYVRQDLMGIVREDLVYDVARHVDSSVHLFEKWGLPIWKNEEGKYVREGKWQIMIHGESYKPIVAEAAKNALGEENILERVFIVKLLLDEKVPNRIAGAVGFSVRENKFYYIKAKAIICACGGAVHIFRPRSTGEGYGRAWYPPWNAGSTYSMMLEVGAPMVNMECRFVPARYKDGYGPVGAWFLLFKAYATNAFDENYIETRKPDLEKYAPYGTIKPVPTCLRNHAMMLDMFEGKFPIFMRTEAAMQAIMKADPKRAKKLEAEAWEDFLDMTVSQSVLWAAENVEPEKVKSEIMPSEPYLMGSHSGANGAWCCGPEDLMPAEYKDDFPGGYNRMTTVEGLFTAGDGVGASAHKFSSGSHTEGRLAAKAAIKYILDHQDFEPNPRGSVEELKEMVYKPLKTFEENKGYTTDPNVNPFYIRPKQFVFRLNKIMDEYCGGIGWNYTTNEPALLRGLEKLQVLKEDAEKLAAENLHELMRAWENYHRLLTAECHLRHILYRKETRWPGYYYRSDYPDMDEQNWRKFVLSRINPDTGEWEMLERPYVQILD
ncbi:MAG: adenylyl-sulfate reductase subunit alpha [Candidatus Desulfofervidaceae bacterium]|nr:adenylyl-sulfate reductase subunit alpha [Candidatus Desulfofervidaceae bacterium]